MFKHNLLLIYRNFKRYKTSFFINLVGLSTGIVCVLLIYLWVQDETHIDHFTGHDYNLYQVMRNEPAAQNIRTEASTPGPLAAAIAAAVPEVKLAVAVVKPVDTYRGILSAGDTHLFVTPQFVDTDYFNMFNIHLMEGNPQGALRNNNAIVISEKLALNLFHTATGVTGKTVTFKNEYLQGTYLISGVFKAQAAASEPYDVLFSYALFLTARPEIKDWTNGGPATYLLLKNGAAVDLVNQKITAVFKNKRRDCQETLFLQRFSARYLNGAYENGVPSGGKIVYVRLLTIIALFILLIACINFINLSTARAVRRMKEVGVKKVIGANRASLIIQYLAEAVLLSFIALFVALLLTELLLPQFNQITGKSLAVHFNAGLLFTLLAIALFTGLLSGSYPALYLSGFNPATALKGKISHSTGELLIRKGLVIVQFIVSIVLIVAVLVVYKQIQFVAKKDLGYDKSQIISFAKEGKLQGNYQAFVSQLKTIPGVVNASYLYGHLAGGVSSKSGGLFWQGQSPLEKQAQFNYLDVDFGLIETLGLKLKSGRAFSTEFGSDTAAIIFNEAAIKAMGLSNPIGKTVNFYGNRQIIGVVEDFHYASLFEKVKPFFFKIDAEEGGSILVKIGTQHNSHTLTQIAGLYKKFNPGVPFNYQFLDSIYQAQYAAENKMAVLSRYFAAVAILISCLGLFGLAAFVAERRLKEIAIRKTLGCSKSGVIYLLSADFLKTILIAVMIAFPVSYLIARKWLDGFAYQITLEWWFFAGGGLLAVLMAAIAVGTQVIKVAGINPAVCLKE